MELMREFSRHVDAFLTDALLAESEAIEQACEMALQGGEHGVLVRTWWEGDKRIVEAGPDPAVPYGHIYREDRL